MSKKSSRPVRRQPQRTCIVCRTTSDKRTLVRIVRMAQGGVAVDERGKVPGRGAYLCHQATCWQSALEGRVLERALLTTLGQTEKATLEEYSRRIATDKRTDGGEQPAKAVTSDE